MIMTDSKSQRSNLSYLFQPLQITRGLPCPKSTLVKFTFVDIGFMYICLMKQ